VIRRPKGIKHFRRVEIDADPWWARGMEDFREQTFRFGGETYLRVSGRRFGDEHVFFPTKFELPFARKRSVTQWYRLIRNETSNAR